jgi:hypothetical protein
LRNKKFFNSCLKIFVTEPKFSRIHQRTETTVANLNPQKNYCISVAQLECVKTREKNNFG